MPQTEEAKAAPNVPQETHDGAPEVELRETPYGLALTDGTIELHGDFDRLASRIRPGRLQGELLVKAARVKGVDEPFAIDATAGLGEDAFLLAAAGFRVRLYERDPIIAALLRDALTRAATSDDARVADAVARMDFAEGDSITALQAMGASSDENALYPDVVLLDPMFPARQKSAAVKKKFQLIHHIERPCDDEDALLQAAIAAGPRKIVIKRPPKGPYLAGVKPAYSLQGKAVRYDCLAFAQRR